MRCGFKFPRGPNTAANIVTCQLAVKWPHFQSTTSSRVAKVGRTTQAISPSPARTATPTSGRRLKGLIQIPGNLPDFSILDRTGGPITSHGRRRVPANYSAELRLADPRSPDYESTIPTCSPCGNYSRNSACSRKRADNYLPNTTRRPPAASATLAFLTRRPHLGDFATPDGITTCASVSARHGCCYHTSHARLSTR